MDPLIAKLNQAVAAQIEIPKGFANAPGGEAGGFQSTLDSKMSERLMEKIMGDSGASQQMNVLSANDVHVETQLNDSIKGNKIEGSNQYFEMFKNVNRDMISMDSAIETLTTPGIKLQPRQLLALQAGVSQASVYAETFSKLTSTLAQNIQTLVQTQV